MRGWALGAVALLTILFTLSPMLVLMISAFDDGKFFRFPPKDYSLRWFWAAIESQEYRSSIWASTVIAGASTLLSVVLGTAAALGLIRGPFKQRKVLETVLLAPLTLPLVVWAIALLQVYSWLGLSGSLAGLILAHTTFTLPFSARIMMASLATLDPALDEAAKSLGAKPLTAFCKVTLPLILPGVVSSIAISFFISFNDVIVSTFIAGASWVTYPVRMYSQLRGQGIDPTTLAIGTMVILSMLLFVGIAELFSRRAAGK